jgi:hypothetical protein
MSDKMSNEDGPSTAPTPKKVRKEPETELKPGVGIATELWLELRPYKKGEPRLWLLVDEEWRYLNLDANSGPLRESVQSAFCNCPGSLEVVVWYQYKDIVGLVVRSKYPLAEI